MTDNVKPRAIGINHVALEVGDIDAALDFYGRVFDLKLRGRADGMAFVDLGDQFIALGQADTAHRDAHRHFGLVVDDKAAVRERLESLGAEILEGDFLDFIDPWGNRVQVVEYARIQFLKHPAALAAMHADDLDKTDAARRELSDKGIVL